MRGKGTINIGVDTMKKMNRVIIAFLTIITFAIPVGIVSAASVANGELIYKGGQTDSKVYSDIRDAIPTNNNKYMVWAAVKVCGNTYSSGWKADQAYKDADRKWYCDETSHYDYYKR